MLNLSEKNRSKMNGAVRTFSMKPIDGAPKAISGQIDRRLFSGENKLRAYLETGLWMFKYDEGMVPGALRQKYTSFNMAKKHAEDYFFRRNVEIKEIYE